MALLTTAQANAATKSAEGPPATLTKVGVQWRASLTPAAKRDEGKCQTRSAKRNSKKELTALFKSCHN
jgi:hypothetical protein